MNLDSQSPLMDGTAGKDPGRVSRRSMLRNSVIIGASVPLGAWGLTACAASPTPSSTPTSTSTSTPTLPSRGKTENLTGLTPDQALLKLKEGNARFVDSKDNDPNLSNGRRVSVAAGQHPFAGIIGCIDSRVPPELVFDRGLGDLFVGRVGAAIADDSQIGGMEFGVLEFGIPLLVRPIIPAVEAAEAKHAVDLLDESVRESIKISVAALRKSPVLSGLITSGKLKVVGARYDLDTGRVDILE